MSIHTHGDSQFGGTNSEKFFKEWIDAQENEPNVNKNKIEYGLTDDSLLFELCYGSYVVQYSSHRI